MRHHIRATFETGCTDGLAGANVFPGENRSTRAHGKATCFRLLVLCPLLFATAAAADERPNIVFIMCDDLGYGDVNCLAPETCKIQTPAADRLAREGMIFTDAHSGSSVCTPTRYGLLTGRYSWRTTLQKGVVTGFEPCLIASERPTVAGFLRSAGYRTAIIGKWHLNFEYTDPATGLRLKRKDHKLPPVDAIIPDGPLSRGFDYFHGFHHARDMEAVIEGDRVIAHDDVINMLPRLTRKSVEYIETQTSVRQPFFLYIPLGSPHTPIVPSAAWQGKSTLGPYGDFVMETDDVLAKVCDALERKGLTKNTLVIFTSDNGCSKAAGIEKLASRGHFVSAHLRGSKADLWDGGHRIPFVARWPDRISAGSTSDQLICHTDLFATVAEIIGKPLPQDSAEDSVSYLAAFSGKTIPSTRPGIVHHSVSGHFAYRMGEWKLLLARGSGGWSFPNENQLKDRSPKAQLYNMTTDVGETTNLYTQEQETAQKLLQQLTGDVHFGRSTKGKVSTNDVPEDAIILWKSEQEAGPRKRKRKAN